MWTEEQRWIYLREGDGYPSDLRDTEWAQLEPLIPSARPGGRPRKIDMTIELSSHASRKARRGSAAVSDCHHAQ
jgi:transposase